MEGVEAERSLLGEEVKAKEGELLMGSPRYDSDDRISDFLFPPMSLPYFCHRGKYIKKHVRCKESTCRYGHVASSIHGQDCLGMGGLRKIE
ncbi:hypothetical protein KI387_023963, partial [Taxus chinensis]